MKRLQWPPIIFVAILVAIFACLAVAGEARRRVDPAPALADTNQLHTAPVGDVRAAIEALRSTATRPGPLQADATRRLAALARVGAVATSDTDLLQAHESLFAAQVNRGDVFDGSLTLDALGELDGKGMSWRLLHARLFAASARMDLTAREYDALLVRVAGQHSIRSIATQIDRVNALLRSRTLEEESIDNGALLHAAFMLRSSTTVAHFTFKWEGHETFTMHPGFSRNRADETYEELLERCARRKGVSQDGLGLFRDGEQMSPRNIAEPGIYSVAEGRAIMTKSALKS